MADHEAPLDNAASFIQQLDTLQEQLQKQLPGYEYSLREIHRNLSSDPALLHILKPEQIGTIVAGLKKKTNTVIAEAATKKGGSGGKRLRDLTEDDI
jgi:hypothetical protein